MSFKDLVVGDTLYCAGEHSSDSRQNRSHMKGVWFVSKLGRKYIEVTQQGRHYPIKIERSDRRSDYKFYLNETEYADLALRDSYISLIRNFARGYQNTFEDIPTDSLAEVINLLQINKEEI